MSRATVTEPRVTSGIDFSFQNGKELAPVLPAETHRQVHFTLKQLPGATTTLGVHVSGEELGRLFTQQPDLPGVILFDDSRFAGVISQSHYYKCISRAFGREVYHRRPCLIMLDGVTVQTLILPADTPIHTAVEECLARPHDEVYEPFLVHDKETGQFRLCAFQVLILASAQLASLRNRQMEQILNSVTDGLLVIDRDFRIGGEYSRVVGSLFERTDLSDARLPEVFRPLVDATTYGQLQDYLKILFDPKLIDRLIKSINPAKQVAAVFPPEDNSADRRIKHFAIDFERIRTQTEISQVLVRIEDITQRMNFAKELEEQEAAAEKKLQLVMQILQIEPGDLHRFVERFNKTLAQIAESIFFPTDEASPRDTVNALFRPVHTLKGEASMLRLSAHQQALHQLEDQLDKLRTAPTLERSELTSLGPFQEKLQALGDQITEALNQLRSLGATARPAASPAHAANGTPTPAPRTLPGLTETLGRWIADLGQRLGKPAHFHTTVRDNDIPKEYEEVLHEVLIHLARNAMVHGLEAPPERGAWGKSPAGLIQFDLKKHDAYYEFIFQDDGRGLDLDKIRRKAEQAGLKVTTDDDVRQALFEPGFSTADTVTDLAGRGVGLDAIRHLLTEVGGRIIPYSEAGAYCAFQILLPRPPHARAA